MSGKNKQKDDIDLVALRKQELQAIECLVKIYNRQMLTVAPAIIGAGLAEEVVQEAWLSIFHSLPAFEGRSSIKTWIYTIVSNQAKTRLRNKSRTVQLDITTNDIPVYLTDDKYLDNGYWASTQGMERETATTEEIKHIVAVLNINEED